VPSGFDRRELLDGLPQRGDIQRYLMHLLRVEGGGGMSAFGGKADMTRTWCVAFDPKRTCN
jgi:hypothetical protein